jgi:hypothetical protein
VVLVSQLLCNAVLLKDTFIADMFLLVPISQPMGTFILLMIFTFRSRKDVFGRLDLPETDFIMVRWKEKEEFVDKV